MLGGDDIALGGEPGNGRENVGGGMGAPEGRDDRVRRTLAVEQREQAAVELAVEQGIEGLGDQ